MTILDGSNRARCGSGTGSWATFSDDGLYRYDLGRRWDLTAGTMCWVMLNPSTADAVEDDQTIRRCQAFAKRDGCGAIAVVNLWALRARDPVELTLAEDSTGPDNQSFVDRWVGHPDVWRVVAGWGATRGQLERWIASPPASVPGGVTLSCLGTTKDRSPRHPSRLGNDVPFEVWRSATDMRSNP